MHIILLKSDTIRGIVYNVHCLPSTNVDVGESASVKADAVVESPKKHKNVLITHLNLTANNFVNYHMVQAFFSFLGEFLCFNGIFLCNGIANVIFFFFSNLNTHVQKKLRIVFTRSIIQKTNKNTINPFH